MFRNEFAWQHISSTVCEVYSMQKQVILCVDDEEMIVNSLQEQIKGMFNNAFDVEVAIDGLEGLELLRNC